MSEIGLIRNASELGAGVRGAGAGVAAIQQAARMANDSFFEDVEAIDVDALSSSPSAINYPYAKHIDVLVNVNRSVRDAVKSMAGKGLFPLILAGDHSSAAGSVQGLHQAYPDKTIGVVWIDAHADFHSPETTPSGNMHGMTLHVVTQVEILTRRNVPNDAAMELWDQISDVRPVLPQHVAFVGVRSVEPEEEDILNRYSIPNFTVSQVQQEGPQEIAARVLQQLADCDMIYISFDVDSMDPEKVSRGTGTPVPNGLNEDEAAHLMSALIQSGKVGALEIVEVNPSLDTERPMAEPAYRVLRSCIDQIQSL